MTKIVDAVVVGAGFAGLYMLHRLREAGLCSRVFEAGAEVGGTWYWNRYPGARCDVESVDYCYSFDESIQQEWVWSERYPTQPELLRYINFVADRLNLKEGITFNTRVTSARFIEAKDSWIVETSTGEVIETRFVIMASGNLSAAKAPGFPGLDDFAGDLLHTNNWPDDVDLAGKTVGIIGTGSTAVQAIPEIAAHAGRLVVFQRTPSFSIPARNRPLDEAELAKFKQNYVEHRIKSRETRTGVIFRSTGKTASELSAAECRAALEEQWEKGGADFPATFTDMMVNRDTNAIAANFVREKIAATVSDPTTAELLTPRDYPLGAKRICLDSNYYETFNRPNVSLIDVRSDPIERVLPGGLKTASSFYVLDVLVLATGFDAMTGPVMRVDIRGVGGVRIQEAWAAGPRTYLGLMTANFPNLFLVTGPGSPSVLTNMVAAIEQHVDWIAHCIKDLKAFGKTRIEPRPEAVEEWVNQVNGLAERTLFMEGNSWYLGANVPGKPRVFMPYLGGLDRYRAICEAEKEGDYANFALS